MLLRLIVTFVLVSTLPGCMPGEIQDVKPKEQIPDQMQNHQTNQDEKVKELYLPGQD
jgi:hypothetical protein